MLDYTTIRTGTVQTLLKGAMPLSRAMVRKSKETLPAMKEIAESGGNLKTENPYRTQPAVSSGFQAPEDFILDKMATLRGEA